MKLEEPGDCLDFFSDVAQFWVSYDQLSLRLSCAKNGVELPKIIFFVPKI